MSFLMHSSKLTHYYRHPGLTKATEENILRKLQTKVDPSIYAVDTELCYNLDVICEFTKEEEEVGMNQGNQLFLYLDYEIHAQ